MQKTAKRNYPGEISLHDTRQLG